MTTIFASPTRQPTSGLLQPARLAALFWIFTYSVLTARGLLSDREVDLLDPRRFLATSAGALIYWLVLHWIGRSARDVSQSSVLSIIGTILPASIAVLAIRLVADWMFSATPSPVEHSLRWVMVWAGYFGMWVSGALALRLQRTVLIKAPTVSAQAPALPASVARPATPAERDALDWLIDACAEHLTASPRPSRAALAAYLVARAGYPIADGFDAEAHNRRVDLALSIAARLLESDGAALDRDHGGTASLH